jgi:hypothetical protein
MMVATCAPSCPSGDLQLCASSLECTGGATCTQEATLMGLTVESCEPPGPEGGTGTDGAAPQDASAAGPTDAAPDAVAE